MQANRVNLSFFFQYIFLKKLFLLFDIRLDLGIYGLFFIIIIIIIICYLRLD